MRGEEAEGVDQFGGRAGGGMSGYVASNCTNQLRRRIEICTCIRNDIDITATAEHFEGFYDMRR